MAQAHYTIGEVAAQTGVSPDTLRYYERLGLLTGVTRSSGGTRRYSEANLASLRFIRRAQKMNFSLSEIGQLLQLRAQPAQACQTVQDIARVKLQAIEAHLTELALLQNELATLVNRCEHSPISGCAILEGLERHVRPE